MSFFNAYETFYLSRNPQALYDSERLNTDVVQVRLERKPVVFGKVLSPVLAVRCRMVLNKVCVWCSAVRVDLCCQRLEDTCVTPSRA